MIGLAFRSHKKEMQGTTLSLGRVVLITVAAGLLETMGHVMPYKQLHRVWPRFEVGVVKL